MILRSPRFKSHQNPRVRNFAQKVIPGLTRLWVALGDSFDNVYNISQLCHGLSRSER